MSNGVYPCHVSAYKNFMPLTFDGGASSLCKSLFSPGDFVARSWNGCILVQKTQATQSVDHACIFRVMRGNSRLTLTIRTSGAVCLRLYKAGGSVQRECQTTSIPTTGNVLHIGYSWDVNRLALSVYDTTAKALVQVVESTTNISSLPAWTEADGIYVGNRADLSLPYKGNIYGGTFGYRSALSGASMAMEAAAGNMAFGSNFVIHPQVMGYRGTGVIREPNHHEITVLNPDKVAFWNLNAPSNVIQEWWRFYATIDDIPPGAIVLDSDGVVKEKRFVVELNGPDTLTFAPINADLKVIDWEFSLLFCDINPSQSTYSRIVQFMAGSFSNIILVANTAGGLEIYLRNNGDVTVHGITMMGSYNDSKYHKITFGMAGGSFYAMTEEAKQTIAVPNWAGTGFSSVLISDTQISIRPIQISKIKQLSGSTVDCFQCNEASSTVMANQCSPSRPATLSDATAHVGALVPVSLLS